MTICLAAIAKNGKEESIIFGTDHMVTTPIGQFEHSIVKYKILNGNTVAMLAGNPLLFEELTQIGNEKNYAKIKRKIFENFVEKRKEILKREIFDVYGIDEKFFLDSLKSPIPNAHIDTILRNVSQYGLNTGILLIGFNGDNAQITEINEKGFLDFREMNFHAIGSGNTQAANTLLFQKHDKKDDLRSTIYNVYKAKRNAEVLQGVGKETELLVLTKKGCYPISADRMNILDDIYQEELNFGKKHLKLKKVGEVR